MEQALNEIEQVLDARVRPALRRHGGEISLVELDGKGILRVRLTGQCAGCPAADLTNEELIERELTQALPGLVRQVVLVQPVSEDLLAQARAILAHER